MLHYPQLRRHPKIFHAVTGLSVAEFDALLGEALPALAAADEARLSRPGRRRAIGAGHPHALPPRDQVLLTVIWLRRYPTDGVLGYLLGVEESTVRRVRHRVLPVLEALGADAMRLPDPGKWQRPDLAGLLAATPELAVIVDTFEQAVQRPKARAAADAWYSGKKKQHTRKVQVVVEATTGRFVDLAAGWRGPTSDLRVLTESGVLDRLAPQIAVLGDLAYVGIAKAHPGGATPKRKPRAQPRPPGDVTANQAFARRRITVEHSIRRRRVFASVTAPDRQHRVEDGRALACAGLVNRQLAAHAALR
jgi:hypothetical protein